MKLDRLDQIAKFEAIIRSVDISKTYEEYVKELATALADGGALLFPVKIGDTVYAAMPADFFGSDEIEPWEVCGVAVDDKGGFFAIDKYGEEYEIGRWGACLTMEAAQEKLREITLSGEMRTDR